MTISENNPNLFPIYRELAELEMRVKSLEQKQNPEYYNKPQEKLYPFLDAFEIYRKSENIKIKRKNWNQPWVGGIMINLEDVIANYLSL